MPSNKLIILNFISFQLLWWACVLSPKADLALAVLFLVVILTAAHLQWIEGWNNALPLLLTAVAGCIFDQAGYQLGLIEFEYHTVWTSYIPLWMIALWLAFACTLNISLGWLKNKPVIAAILGGIFGPVAFLGAAKLGVVNLPYPILSLAWISLEWAIAMPLLLWIRHAFNETTTMRYA